MVQVSLWPSPQFEDIWPDQHDLCRWYRLWEVPIPPGGGHGYKALGLEPIQLVYFTDRHYNPLDEFRIVYNHHAVAYDWENAAQISSCAF